MSSWTKVGGDNTLVHLTNLVGRLQRVMLARKVASISQMLELHPLDAATQTKVKAHLADLTRRIQGE